MRPKYQEEVQASQYGIRIQRKEVFVLLEPFATRLEVKFLGSVWASNRKAIWISTPFIFEKNLTPFPLKKPHDREARKSQLFTKLIRAFDD
jgi:hypothetical protein